MRELLAQMEQWQAQGKGIALATVIQAHGSSPRPLGAKMAVSSSGEMAGSVSAGCVEGAVAEEALQVLSDGQPRLLEYGISDETAWGVGLTCGGLIQVFVEAFSPPGGKAPPLFEELRQSLQAEQAVALATIIAGEGLGDKRLAWPDGRHSGSLGDARLDRQADTLAQAGLQSQQNSRYTLQSGSAEVELFIDVYPPPPRLVIVGAVHIAIPLVRLANLLGFHTIVIDPRRSFITPQRFPHASERIKAWPEEAFGQVGLDAGCYVVTLSHDAKLDNPALYHALLSPARYVGALGSRRTHQIRVNALEEMGLGREEIGRIHAPVGLDIGSSSPEEIALAILAEVTAARRGKLPLL